MTSKLYCVTWILQVLVTEFVYCLPSGGQPAGTTDCSDGGVPAVSRIYLLILVSRVTASFLPNFLNQLYRFLPAVIPMLEGMKKSTIRMPIAKMYVDHAFWK